MTIKSFLLPLLIFSLISISLNGYSQTANNHGSPTDLPTIIPPSPNATSFQKYGNIPVSSYTGVPDISIPLYQITTGDISVPITLSYHASGIKVAEESSRVGLGWVLNAGGVISRNVIGADDFLSSANSYMNTSAHTSPDITSGIGGNVAPTFNIQTGCTPAISGMPDISTYLNAGFDFEPDQYYYNFLNYSGKFIVKSSGAAILEKQEKINIAISNANGDSWIITREDGFKYTFNQYETFTDYSTSGNPTAIKSAWYLTQIISPTGNQVTFQYSTQSNYIKSIGAYSETQNNSIFSYTPASQCNITSSGYPSGIVRGAVPGKQYTNVFLDKIIFRGGEVRVAYADDRQDVENDRRISSLQIYFSNQGAYNLIKTWQFNQDYFTGTSDEDYSLGIPTNYVTKRMKLSSLAQGGPSGNFLPPYQFHYNNESDPSQSLPAKTSFARDHWGFYNGKTNNTSLVPSFSPSTANDIVVQSIGIMGDNRNTDPQYSGLFALNQIIYPAGGNTLFEMESNDVDLIKSAVNDHSFSSAHPEAKLVTQQIPYSGTVADQPTPNATDITDKTLDLSALYTDPNTPTSSVALTAFFRFQNSLPCTYSQFSQYNSSIYFTLTKSDGSFVENVKYPFQDLGNTAEPSTSCVLINGTATTAIAVTFSNHYLLTPGKYIWHLHIGSNVTFIADVSLTVRYTAIVSSTGIAGIYNNGQTVVNADYAGGLRIKRITDKDGLSQNNAIVRRYDYHYYDSLGRVCTYGKRMVRPIYSYIQPEYKEQECNSNSGTQYLNTLYQKVMYGSDSNVPLNGSANGNIVGYDCVTEYIGENGENGKNVYYYNNTPDIVLDYSYVGNFSNYMERIPLRPAPCSTVPFPDNGNLIEQKSYLNNNGQFVMIKDIQNSYSEMAGQNNWAWFGIDSRPWKGSFLVSNNCDRDNLVYPAIISSRVVLSSSTETIYDPKDVNSRLSKTTIYSYDNTTHKQLVSKNEKLSDGRYKETDYTYPADYADNVADAVLQSMKTDRFMHSKVVTQIEKIKNADGTSNVTAGTINRYQISNGSLFPSQIAVLDVSSPQNSSTLPAYAPLSGNYPTGFESRLNFDYYDNNGNLVQVHKIKDLSLSYIWDYNNSYPVAEVQNAVQAEIAYTSFEADGKGNWNNYTGTITTVTASPFPPTGNKYYNLTPTASLYKAVTAGSTYIISYWSSGSNPFTINGGTGNYKAGRSINGWTYYEHKISASAATLTIFGTGAIDEVRLYPANAQMKTFTYEPLIGIKSKCDINSGIIYYEYDNLNRLKIIRDQVNKIIKKFDYQYQQQP